MCVKHSTTVFSSSRSVKTIDQMEVEGLNEKMGSLRGLGRKRRNTAAHRRGGYAPLMARRGTVAVPKEENKVDARKEEKIKKVTREIVRREGKFFDADKGHGRTGSGLLQVVQVGSKYF